MKTKMNIVDGQMAFEYVVYMILGSYFDKAICKNKLQEKKMYFQYMQQKDKAQIQMEEYCIRFVERVLMPQLPPELWSQQVEVKFVPTSVQGMREVQFIGPDFALRASGIYRGKRETRMHYQARDKYSCLVAE